MKYSPSWEAKRSLASQEIPRTKEPGETLPSSQEPATCPCPELDEYSPRPPERLLRGPF